MIGGKLLPDDFDKNPFVSPGWSLVKVKEYSKKRPNVGDDRNWAAQS